MIHGQDAAGRRLSVDNQRANGHDKHVSAVKARNRHARGGRAGEIYRFVPIAWCHEETPWQARRQPRPCAIFLLACHAIREKR
jgi:hypothetical protein